MWIKNIHDRSPFSLFIHALFCTMSRNKVMFPISEGNLNFLLCSENLRRDLCWQHCKYKEWVSFFLGSWEMNRSAEQTNRTRTAFAVHAICLFRTAIHFPWTEKKRHSFLNLTFFSLLWSGSLVQKCLICTFSYPYKTDERTSFVRWNSCNKFCKMCEAISIRDWFLYFNFHILNVPFLSSNISSSPAYGVFISQLIRHARACSS